MSTKTKRPDVEVVNGIEVDVSESNKVIANAPLSNQIDEFLDWLNQTKGYHIGEYIEIKGYREHQFTQVHPNYNRLLAEYFDIDLDLVEKQRTALLVALQAGADGKGA